MGLITQSLAHSQDLIMSAADALSVSTCLGNISSVNCTTYVLKGSPMLPALFLSLASKFTIKNIYYI